MRARAKGFGAKGEAKAAQPAAPGLGVSGAAAAPAVGVEALPDAPGKSAAARKAAARGRKQVDVYAPAVEQSKAVEPTFEAGAETAYIQFLGVYFSFLILLGLVIAGSAFLPDEADAFIAGNVFPYFTPAVGGFLALSSAYGVWKAYIANK